MDDEEPEGMFSLVGTPDDPQLSEEEMSEEDRDVDIGERSFTEEEVELAHETLEKVREVTRRVSRIISPTNVVVASLFMAFLLFSTFALVFWAVPRDAITVDVVYMQSGPGQVVLVEVHNLGTKPISDVTIEVKFTDLDGDILNSTRFHRSEIPAHTSVAGDDLELLIEGVTVWANYHILVTLEYDYYGGTGEYESWNHTVGDWTTETFKDKADRHWF